MTTPILYHDPTSEPSRAVHWFCLAADIPVQIDHVWLTRGEHRSERLLAVNPRHQVPALAHDGFHLSEATAIMSYLAEVHGCSDRWFGASAAERAHIAMLLSWYHTSIRLEVTLDYFLPFLLMPAYHATPRPEAEEVAEVRGAFEESLGQLHALLQDSVFLAADRVTAPDLLFASELFALDMDPDRGDYIDSHQRVATWLEHMHSVAGYDGSHAAWNHVVPMLTERWRQAPAEGWDPGWIADACLEVLRIAD